VREAVQDGETGFLVPDRDVDALTRTVAELLENREKRLSMGREARKMVEDNFDIRAIQEQYLEIYRELGVDI
jgi:glycosyltransferase involved in cell wall biosynthesis